MAQYSIPQFIEEEGKIIFFMTFRQFFLLIAGAIICVFLYLTVPFLVFIIGSLFVMGFFAMVAFLKIENERVLKLLMHFINFSTKNKNYVWQKEEYSPQYNEPQKLESTEITKEVVAPTPTFKTTTKSRLSEAKKIIELSNK